MQYRIRYFTVKYCKVKKAWDQGAVLTAVLSLTWKSPYNKIRRSLYWEGAQVLKCKRCPYVCQISEQLENCNHRSGALETLQDLAIRLMRYWIAPRFCPHGELCRMVVVYHNFDTVLTDYSMLTSNSINSLTPGWCGSILKAWPSDSFYRLISWVIPVKLFSILKIPIDGISQH